jgi:hypothetical protein
VLISQRPAGDLSDITDPPYPSMPAAGVTTFIADQEVSGTSVIQFVALVRDDELATFIRAAREDWMAEREFYDLGINNPLAWLTPVVVRSRLDALKQIISTTSDAARAAEWRVFDRYCAGK